MNNQTGAKPETFYVEVDGITYSTHVYFADALKLAMSVGSMFAHAHVEVVSSKDRLDQIAAVA